MGDSITNRWKIAGGATWTRFAGQAADFESTGDKRKTSLA
jgi:hypothetical protein